MNWLASLFDAVRGWLAAIPGLHATSEHVALLQQRLRDREEELSQCQQRSRELEQQVGSLHEQVAKLEVAEQFVEERGALFKKRPGGGYHDAVYCPTCKVSAFARSDLHFLECQTCRWKSTFTRREVPGIIAGLIARDG